MAKQKKKRNKVYRGTGAGTTHPVVTKISAADRSSLAQWWFEKKRFARPIIITALVAFAIIWIIVEIVRVTTS